MGRPVKNSRRDLVDASFSVAATGCQWRALPERDPHWHTVHRDHLRWSREGTGERICDRLYSMVRVNDGREPQCAGSVIDARRVRGAATVTSSTRGDDAGEKISGRKVFGVVDTVELLVAILVVAASTSDNVGGGPSSTRPGRRASVWPTSSATAGSSERSSPTAVLPTSPPRSSRASRREASRSCLDGGSSSGRGRGG